MADPTIRARLILDTSGYQSGAAQAKKTTGTFGQIRNTMVGVFGGNLMTAAASKAKDFFTGAITGAVQAEQASAIFGQTLSNLGFAKQIGPANDFLASLSKQAALSKGELRPAFEQMLRSTHDFGTAQRATTLATNIAAGSHRSLSTVTLALSRAFNGQTAGLSRLGIKVNEIVPNYKKQEAAQASVKKATEAYLVSVKKYGANSDQARAASGRMVDAQHKLAAAQKETKKQALPLNQIIANLNKTFGGDAQKAANTTAGRMKNAQLQFKAFQITIGQTLLPVITSLLGVFEQFMPVLQSFANWAKANPGMLKILASAILGIVVVMKAWKIATALWATAQGIANAAAAVFNAIMAANPIVLIVLAIVALIAILVILQMKFGILTIAAHAIWAALQAAFHAIVAAGQWLFNFFASHWPLLVAILLGPIGIVALLIIRNFDTIKRAAIVFVNALITIFNFLKGPVLAVVNFLRTIWNGFIAFIRGIIGVVGGIAAAIGHAFGVIGSIVGGIIGGVRNVINGFVGFIQGVVGTIGGIAGRIASAIKAPINAVIGGLNAIQVNIGPWTLPSVTLPKLLGGGTIGGNTIGPWHFGFPHITPLQVGGLVTSEGLFHLHAGEAVTPAPLVARGAPLINIENAYFGDQVDVDTFASRVAWHAARSTA